MEAIKSEFDDFWQAHGIPHQSTYAEIIPIRKFPNRIDKDSKKLSNGVLIWRWCWVSSLSIVAAIIVVLGIKAGISSFANNPIPAKHLTYLVQPGDTLWSIARKIEPQSDPRPLVYSLDSQLHGARIYPGEKIKVSY